METAIDQPTHWRLLWALAALALASLSGCGGSDSTSSATTPPPTTTSVPVTVIDGPIKGVVVCLDKNSNGLCDSGEPTATTDASGNATLTVDNADVGKFPIVAMVGTDAVDADTGPVTTAYTMRAPADATSVVSPLTTLVQAEMDTDGGTSAQAADVVKSATGLTVSVLANYVTTRSTDAGAKAASNLARLLVLTTQQQLGALAPVVGSTDISGATVSNADLQRAVTRTLLGALPAMAAAVSDASVSGASTAASTDAALAALAAKLIANGQAGLTADSVPMVVGMQKLPADAAATTPTAGASLRALTYTDANNWFFRAMESTAADNTPDANGLVHYYDNRTQNVAGVTTSWGFQSTPARQTDLHWNGSAWVDCALGFRSSQLPRDANGHTIYNYCDSYETGVSTRVGVDIAGKTLSAVVATIRATPGSDSSQAYASFGPSDLNALGTAAFPAGSTLWYYTNSSQSEAYAYIINSTVLAYSAALAAGGASSTSTACASVTSSNVGTFRHVAATLEEVIATNPGHPCIYGQSTAADGSTSLPSNEWWDQSSVNVGTLTGAVTPPSAFYTTNEVLRVAFDASGNGVTYLSCLTQASGGSSRNCTPIGSGSYVIRPLGDARVLTLSNPPLEVVRLGYARVFVERAGVVYFGYQSNLATSRSVRLNLPAANALLAKLGMPALAPN